jgi:hypothetical protein
MRSEDSVPEIPLLRAIMTTWPHCHIGGLKYSQIMGGTGVANPDAGAGFTPDKHEQEGGGEEVSVPPRNFQNFESEGTRDFWCRPKFFVAGMIIVSPKALPRRSTYRLPASA